MNSIIVKAEWDADAAVWTAVSDDVPGLVAEAETLEALRAKLPGMIADMIEENGLKFDPVEIPVHIVTHQVDRISNPTAA